MTLKSKGNSIEKAREALKKCGVTTDGFDTTLQIVLNISQHPLTLVYFYYSEREQAAKRLLRHAQTGAGCAASKHGQHQGVPGPPQTTELSK